MKLLSIDLVTLVEYIQTSIEILMNLKSEEVAIPSHIVAAQLSFGSAFHDAAALTLRP